MNAAVSAELMALAARLSASTVAVRLGRHGGGSGVIWSADGTIVTNAHVASRRSAEVVLSDGRSFRADVDRRDVARDLAVLHIDATMLPAAAVRDPRDLRVGELLVAVGHPLGIPNALTMGIAHAPLRDGGRRFVSADLRLAPGNSGGPLADIDGRVVGINSMTIDGSLALAVPSDDVQRFLGLERSDERLGVRLVPTRLRDGRAAFVIVEIEAESRAAHAGLFVGDVILEAVARTLRAAPAIEVVRGGVVVTVTIPQPAPASRAA